MLSVFERMSRLFAGLRAQTHTHTFIYSMALSMLQSKSKINYTLKLKFFRTEIPSGCRYCVTTSFSFRPFDLFLLFFLCAYLQCTSRESGVVLLYSLHVCEFVLLWFFVIFSSFGNQIEANSSFLCYAHLICA